MIITKLCGGLGNQMFQYALGRRISYINHMPLILDISEYSLPSAINRTYMLHVFNIEEEFAFSNKIRPVNKPARLLRRYTDKVLKYYRKHIFKLSYIQERHFHFDPSVLTLTGRVYLQGYWQSEKYFHDIADIIREDFTFRKEPDEINKRMAEKIKKTNSVCVHVRRGDYFSNSANNKIHGTCSPDYYKRCISIIAEKISEPHFFIFSDEPAWAQENIKPDFSATYVTHNDLHKGFEDMRLMMHCKHFIIANSSFSWWGVWLSLHPAKIVLAPKKWFNIEEFDCRDLIPEGWIRI